MLSKLKKAIPETHPLRLLFHRSKAFAAALRYGFPARRLYVVGVTGTDGKTTTVGMVAHVLQKSGRETAALSTAFFQTGADVRWNATQKTSPGPFAIQKFLHDAKKRGCTHAVLEYSSHGLLQGRTWFTWPRAAAITNLSEEHLDYHGTMEKYLAAKKILFRMLKGKGTKVLNGDDRSYKDLVDVPSFRTVVTTASPKHGAIIVGTATLLWLDEDTRDAETRTIVHVESGHKEAERHPLSLQIPGTFNRMNALTAVGCAIGCGVPAGDALAALASFQGIPGRMENIDEGQPFKVYVDFTVTPQAYEKTLSALKAECAGRLLVLAGSCGDRMKEKRPIVGKIVSRYADVAVIANEDPYTEDPRKIIDEVWAGMDHSKLEAHRIFDRREAIEFLLKEARPGDTVVLCGKGSDTTMWVATGQIPWNERHIVRDVLRDIVRK
jgi:UDP-N-acetylmuramoyl-L-alanyl-D-glutamate--2,6-diaminopimelate ligase